MKNFAGSIIWQGTALDYINEGVLTLPDGEKRTIIRESRQSMVRVANGPLYTGESKFYLVMPDNTRQEFPSFDDLMTKGLKQPRIDDD